MYASVLSRSDNPIAMEQSPKSGSISSIKKLAPQKTQQYNTRPLTIPNHLVESNTFPRLNPGFQEEVGNSNRRQSKKSITTKILSEALT